MIDLFQSSMVGSSGSASFVGASGAVRGHEGANQTGGFSEILGRSLGHQLQKTTQGAKVQNSDSAKPVLKLETVLKALDELSPQEAEALANKLMTAAEQGEEELDSMIASLLAFLLQQPLQGDVQKDLPMVLTSLKEWIARPVGQESEVDLEVAPQKLPEKPEEKTGTEDLSREGSRPKAETETEEIATGTAEKGSDLPKGESAGEELDAKKLAELLEKLRQGKQEQETVQKNAPETRENSQESEPAKLSLAGEGNASKLQTKASEEDGRALPKRAEASDTSATKQAQKEAASVEVRPVRLSPLAKMILERINEVLTRAEKNSSPEQTGEKISGDTLRQLRAMLSADEKMKALQGSEALKNALSGHKAGTRVVHPTNAMFKGGGTGFDQDAEAGSLNRMRGGLATRQLANVYGVVAAKAEAEISPMLESQSLKMTSMKDAMEMLKPGGLERVSAQENAMETKNSTQATDTRNEVRQRFGDETVEKFLKSMRANMKLWARKNFITLDVKADPPELGRIHIRTTVVDGKMGAIIRTESAAAREILNANAEDLKSYLAQKGHNLVSFEVETRDHDDRQAMEGFFRRSKNPKAVFSLDGEEGEGHDAMDRVDAYREQGLVNRIA